MVHCGWGSFDSISVECRFCLCFCFSIFCHRLFIGPQNFPCASHQLQRWVVRNEDWVSIYLPPCTDTTNILCVHHSFVNASPTAHPSMPTVNHTQVPEEMTIALATRPATMNRHGKTRCGQQHRHHTRVRNARSLLLRFCRRCRRCCAGSLLIEEVTSH